MKDIKNYDSDVGKALYGLALNREFMAWLTESRAEILDKIDAPPPVDVHEREYNCGKSRQILDLIETITLARKKMDKMAGRIS